MTPIGAPSPAVQRVWILLSNRWNSAITEYALCAAMALQRRGHTVLFSPRAGSPAETRARGLGLSTQVFQSFGILESGRFLLTRRRFRPTLTLTFGGPETFWVNALGVPASHNIRFRGQDEDMIATSPTRWQRGLRNIHGILVPGSILREKIGIHLTLPVSAVTLGRDDGVFKPCAASRFDRPKLIVFGRFDPIKGHRRFLLRFADLVHNWSSPISKPHCMLVGLSANLTGEDLNRMVRELHLEDHVSIDEQRVEDVPALMCSATVGVIPSIGSEVICRVAEEFLLCGTPIWVSGVGSLEETLFPGAGKSYRTMSPETYRHELEKLIVQSFTETPEQKRQRAHAAGDLFSLDRMGQQLEALL